MNPPMFYDERLGRYFHPPPPPPDLVFAMISQQPLNACSVPPQPVLQDIWPNYLKLMDRRAKRELGKLIPMQALPPPGLILEHILPSSAAPSTVDGAPSNSKDSSVDEDTSDNNEEAIVPHSSNPESLNMPIHMNGEHMDISSPGQQSSSTTTQNQKKAEALNMPIRNNADPMIMSRPEQPSSSTTTPTQKEPDLPRATENSKSVRTHIRVKEELEDPDDDIIRRIISEYKAPPKIVKVDSALVQKRKELENKKIRVKQELICEDETTSEQPEPRGEYVHSKKADIAAPTNIQPPLRNKVTTHTASERTNSALKVMMTVKQEPIAIYDDSSAISNYTMQPCEDKIIEKAQNPAPKPSYRRSVDISNTNSETNSIASTNFTFTETDQTEVDSETKDFLGTYPECSSTKIAAKRTFNDRNENDKRGLSAKKFSADPEEKELSSLNNTMAYDDVSEEEMDHHIDIKPTVRIDRSGTHVFGQHVEESSSNRGEGGSHVQPDEDAVEFLFDTDDHMAEMALRYHGKTPTIHGAPPPFQKKNTNEKVTFLANEGGIFRMKQRTNVNGQITKKDLSLMQVYKVAQLRSISPEDGWTDAAEKEAFGIWMKMTLDKHLIRKTAERYCELCPSWRLNPSYKSLLSGSFAPIVHQKWLDYKFLFTFCDGAPAIRRVRLGSLPKKETVSAVVFSRENVLEPIGGWLNKEEMKRLQRWIEREIISRRVIAGKFGWRSFDVHFEDSDWKRILWKDGTWRLMEMPGSHSKH